MTDPGPSPAPQGTPAPTRTDDRYRLVSVVAERLGAVVHRRAVEARLRRRLATMAAVAEEAEEAFLALGLEGDVLGVDRRFPGICSVLPHDGRPGRSS